MQTDRPNIAGGGVAILAITLMLLLAVTPPWLNIVESLQNGPYTGLDGARADYMFGAFWAVLLTLVVVGWGTAVEFRGPLLLAWAAKVVIAQGPMLLYDFTYGVDPDGYYRNGAAHGFQWGGLVIGQGTTNMHELVYLHATFLARSFSSIRLSWAFIGLVAIYLAYRAAVGFTGREDRRMFYVIAFAPSILFWSSILGKDPVSMLSVCLYLYGVSVWLKQERSVGLLWICLGVAVAIHLRSWLGPILLVPVAVFLAIQSRLFIMKVTYVVVAAAGLTFGPTLIQAMTGVEVGNRTAMVQRAGQFSQAFETGGSTQAMPEISSYRDLAAFAPFGMFTILFRPFPGEVRNLFGSLAGVENFILLMLALRSFIRFKRTDLSDPVVMWALSILILWSAVYSVVSFQNLGTASRYRLEITPLLLGTLLYIGRRRDVVPQAERDGPVALPGMPLRTHWNL